MRKEGRITDKIFTYVSFWHVFWVRVAWFPAGKGSGCHIWQIGAECMAESEMSPGFDAPAITRTAILCTHR